MAKETGHLISEPNRLTSNFLYDVKLVPLLRDGQRKKGKKKSNTGTNKEIQKRVNKDSKLHGNQNVNERLGKIALDINARLYDGIELHIREDRERKRKKNNGYTP